MQWASPHTLLGVETGEKSTRAATQETGVASTLVFLRAKPWLLWFGTIMSVGGQVFLNDFPGEFIWLISKIEDLSLLTRESLIRWVYANENRLKWQ